MDEDACCVETWCLWDKELAGRKVEGWVWQLLAAECTTNRRRKLILWGLHMPQCRCWVFVPQMCGDCDKRSQLVTSTHRRILHWQARSVAQNKFNIVCERSPKFIMCVAWFAGCGFIFSTFFLSLFHSEILHYFLSKSDYSFGCPSVFL